MTNLIFNVAAGFYSIGFDWSGDPFADVEFAFDKLEAGPVWIRQVGSLSGTVDSVPLTGPWGPGAGTYRLVYEPVGFEPVYSNEEEV